MDITQANTTYLHSIIFIQLTINAKSFIYLFYEALLSIIKEYTS